MIALAPLADDSERVQALSEAERPPARVTREAIARWSGVACLYVGTAAALACFWSPT